MLDQNLLGWHRDDDAVEAFTGLLYAQTGVASFAQAQPSLSGHWERLVGRGMTRVLAQDFELAVLGANLPADFQRRGTCVGRGTYRAIQDSYFYDLAYGHVVGVPAQLAFEPIYAGSRVNIGGGRLGRGDGAVGAWAAQFVREYGVVRRGRYGSVDLSQPNEGTAVDWGNPGGGVPREVLDEGRQHRVIVHRVRHVMEMPDCLAAGYFMAYCSPYVWGDRDRNGMSRLSERGAHCTEINGVFLLPNGDTAFSDQQSWGQLPNGPDVLQTAGGPVKLRPGAYGAYAGDLQKGLDDGGECWAFKLETEFRGSIGDMM